MQKCPICGEEIYSLIYEAKEDIMAWFRYNEKTDECEYSRWDRVRRLIVGVTATWYCCPECDEFLFNSEDEAKEFLKSGELPEHRIPYFVERKLSQ